MSGKATDHDHKGIYEKTPREATGDFTKTSSPCEEPSYPKIIVSTGKEGPAESAGKIFELLKRSWQQIETSTEKLFGCFSISAETEAILLC